jgi:hypothetical protein
VPTQVRKKIKLAPGNVGDPGLWVAGVDRKTATQGAASSPPRSSRSPFSTHDFEARFRGEHRKALWPSRILFRKAIAQESFIFWRLLVRLRSVYQSLRRQHQPQIAGSLAGSSDGGGGMCCPTTDLPWKTRDVEHHHAVTFDLPGCFWTGRLALVNMSTSQTLQSWTDKLISCFDSSSNRKRSRTVSEALSWLKRCRDRVASLGRRSIRTTLVEGVCAKTAPLQR